LSGMPPTTTTAKCVKFPPGRTDKPLLVIQPAINRFPQGLHGSTAPVVARRMLERADLVIAALGYLPNALPLFDMNGQAMPLAEAPNPLVDRECRVLDINGPPIPCLLGLGLAAGFIPSGALGGEPSFRGQTNGIWLWQSGVGAMILDALVYGKVDHVANSAAAQ
jgi:hypothetical protein